MRNKEWRISMDDFFKVWVAFDKSVRAHQIRQSFNFYLRDCYSQFFSEKSNSSKNEVGEMKISNLNYLFRHGQQSGHVSYSFSK